MSRMYDIRPEQRDNYFVRTYAGRDHDKIEMSFNLSTYQPHLKARDTWDVARVSWGLSIDWNKHVLVFPPVRVPVGVQVAVTGEHHRQLLIHI